MTRTHLVYDFFSFSIRTTIYLDHLFNGNPNVLAQVIKVPYAYKMSWLEFNFFKWSYPFDVMRYL